MLLRNGSAANGAFKWRYGGTAERFTAQQTQAQPPSLSLSRVRVLQLSPVTSQMVKNLFSLLYLCACVHALCLCLCLSHHMHLHVSLY